MSEWWKEHAWKAVPLARADAHQSHQRTSDQGLRTTTMCIRVSPANQGVSPGFEGVSDTVLTQKIESGCRSISPCALVHNPKRCIDVCSGLLNCCVAAAEGPHAKSMLFALGDDECRREEVTCCVAHILPVISATRSQTTLFLPAAARKNCALAFGVRFCVLKSTYTMPNRFP